MSQQAKTRLEFGINNGGGAGFASPHIDRENTTEEIVVRELLQNALDASSGGKVEVDFSYDHITANRLPCYRDYATAFHAARNHRKSRKVSSPAERHALDRIRLNMIPNGRGNNMTWHDMPVLACWDNGVGIDVDALRSLYDTGDTTKQSGRGSVGLGHLASFAVSDTRLVYYAGRQLDGDETFGGHAILASHMNGSNQLDAHGFIRGSSEPWGQPASLANGEKTIPAVLNKWIPSNAPNGSLVLISGYDPGGRYEASVSDGILASAAKNFMVAIHDDLLDVSCRDTNRHSTLTRTNLRSVLSARQKDTRRRRSVGMAGAKAWLALDAIENGLLLPPNSKLPGVRIWFKQLEMHEETSVSFFRQGMWITDIVPHLRRSDFSDRLPFCAVIDAGEVVGNNKSVCTLVREAEGTSHSQITLSEITSPQKQKALDTALKRIAKILTDQSREFTGDLIEPYQLRIFKGTHLTATMPAYAKRHRSNVKATVSTAQSSTTASSTTSSSSQKNAKSKPKPRPKAPAIRSSSCHSQRNVWDVQWKTIKSEAKDIRFVAVLPGGADETSQSHEGVIDEELPIAKVVYAGQAYKPLQGATDVILKRSVANSTGTAEVYLSGSLSKHDKVIIKVEVEYAN